MKMQVQYVSFFWTGNDSVHEIFLPKWGIWHQTPNTTKKKKKRSFGEALFLTTSQLFIHYCMPPLPLLKILDPPLAVNAPCYPPPKCSLLGLNLQYQFLGMIMNKGSKSEFSQLGKLSLSPLINISLLTACTDVCFI